MGLDSALSREADFHELEQQELLTGEPRYPEDEARNAFLSTILGAVAAVVLLVACILTWILYYRDRTSTLLSYAIVVIFVILFAGACAAWGAGARTAILSKRQPASLFTLIVFLLSLAAMIYLLGMAMWLTFFQARHYDYLVGMYSMPGKADARMPSGWSFDDSWKQDKRMLYWITTFTVIAAICFAFIAYSAANVVWNKYQLMRYALYFILASMTLAGWLVIYWAEEAYHKRVLIDNEPATQFVKALKVMAIISLVVAFLNLIANVLKLKVGYFVMAICCLAIFVILVAIDAPLWRLLRKENKDEYYDGSDRTCKVSMYNLHENQLNEECSYNGGKYLPPNQSCGKEFIVNRWEDGKSSDVRSLNPGCCLFAKHVFLSPFLHTAFWGLILMISAALAMVINFYLADTTEYLRNSNKTLGIGDYIGIAAVILLSVAFGLYFIIRSKREDDPIANKVSYIQSYLDPAKNPIDGYTRVPAGLLDKVNPKLASQPATGSICFPYDTATLPTPAFQTTGSSCTNQDQCYIRMAIAVGNGAILQVGDIGSATRASGDNRYTFFPQCANVIDNNGYVFFYGTQDQLKTVVNNLKICPKSVADTPTVYYYSDQVKMDDIRNNGLVTGDVSTNDASNQNSGLCGSGFTSTSCSTAANCKYTNTLNTQAYTRTLKGKFYYIKNGQKMYDVPNTVGFGGTDNTGNVGSGPTLFNDGTFVIQNIPVYKSSPYRLRLVVSDSSGTFLSTYEDIVIDPKTARATEISAGEIRLDTKDGLVCQPFINATCVASQVHQKGDINLIVFDGSNAAAVKDVTRIQGASVALYKGHVVDGTPILTAISDNNGAVLFKGIPYGPYTLIGSRDGFAPSATYTDLQAPSVNPKPLILLPNISDFDFKVSADMMNPVADFDLILQMKTPEGKECEVNPYNKYCPYSYHVSDITTGPGTESIMIKQLSVATYNSFVKQSPAYDESCSANQFITSKAYHFQQQSLNWIGHYQGSEVVKILPGTILTSQVGGRIDNDLSFTERVLRSIPVKPVVETKEEQALSKVVIRENNVALAKAQQYSRNTSYTVSNSSFVPTSPSSTTSQASASNTEFTFVKCTDPPAGSTDCINGTRTLKEGTSTDHIRLINYTIGGAVVSMYSNETHVATFTNNASQVSDKINIINSKTTSDNTTVNKTTRNYALATPNGTNETLTSEKIITLLANKSTTTTESISSIFNSADGTKTSFKNDSSSTTTPGGNNYTSYGSSDVKSTNVSATNGNNTNLKSNSSITTHYQNTNGADLYGYSLDRNEKFTNGTNVVEKSLINKTATSLAYDYSYDIQQPTSTNVTFSNKTTETFDKSTGANSTTSTVKDKVTYTNKTAQDKTTTSIIKNVTNTDLTTANTTDVTIVYTGTFLGPSVEDHVNMTVRSNNTKTSSFNGSTATNASASVIFERTIADDYDINYTVAADATVTSCKIQNSTRWRVQSNATEELKATLDRTCIYRNGSTVAFKNVSYIEVSTIPTGKMYRNNTVLTINVTHANGTKQDFTVNTTPEAASPVPGPKRRRLAEVKAAHAVSGAGSYIQVSCFTGFGDISSISLNTIQDTLPTIDNCINLIKAQKADFTVEKLKEAVANFK